MALDGGGQHGVGEVQHRLRLLSDGLLLVHI
jgi:hypothetical protein